MTAAPGGNGPARRAKAAGRGRAARDTPPGRPGPLESERPPPHPPAISQSGRTRAAPGTGEGESHEDAEARDAGTPLTRRPMTTNR